jgi:hypothetical protein
LKRRVYEVTDDSGFLAVIDPASYRSFVHAHWTLDQVVMRFKEEMSGEHMLIWGTGREDTWRVEVAFRRSSVGGFREFTAPLSASGDQLLLTNFESLTMAAEFEDIKLPEAYQNDLLIPVQPARYLCRVVQWLNPESSPDLSDRNPDFRIELAPIKSTAKDGEDVPGIPWTDF